MATGRSGSFNISTSNQFVSGYVSWNETYDIASNSSVVSAELRLSRTNTGYETYSSGEFYIAINGNEKRNSGTFSFTYNSNTLCVSHSVTVPHNADGSKSIEIYAGGELYYISPGLTVSKQSSTVTLTTIPRASSLSAPNGTLGSTIRLSVNRASTAFTHTINWSAGGQSGSLTGVGAYVDWSVPYAVANGNTSGTSVACSFTLITYNGGTEIGRSTAGCTLYIPNNSTTKPSLTLGNITVTNIGNIFSWSEAVKGESTLKLSVSSASGKYGADIESYRIVTTDGKSSNTSSIEVTPSTSGTYTITVTVTDTRGFTNTASKSISVYDYAPPVISSASVSRCTSGGSSANEGTYVKINASYGYTNINEKNSITSAYASYRVSGSGAGYTSLGNISNGTSVVLGNGQFNIGASYDIRLTVTDTVGESDTYDLTLSTAKANIVAGLNKLGLGKYPEKDGYLEIGYNVDFEDPDQARNAIGASNGLTTITEKAPNDDPNQITKTGFYSAQSSNLAPGSSGRSHILHIEGQENYAIQFQFDYNQQVEAIRKKLAGVWEEWDFVNPPMLVGVEYRTTERWNDNTVYRKLIKYRFTTSMTGNNVYNIPHEVIGLNTASGVEIIGKTNNYNLPYIAEGESTSINGVTSTYIQICTTGATSWGVNRDWYFDMKYTKIS